MTIIKAPGLWIAGLFWVLLLMSGCRAGVKFPFGGGQAATPTPSPAEAVLRDAVNRLNAAQSYRFTVEAIHTWTFEGKEQHWAFTGNGALVQPGRFQSRLEGPADTVMVVDIDGGLVKAYDPRGPVVGASTSFGGPGPGTAPYTVIAYVKNFEQAANIQALTQNNQDIYTVQFSPRRASVAALDAGQAQDMARVTAVDGEAQIRRSDGTLSREMVRVDFQGRSGDKQTVTMTLNFSDYNQPVRVP